MTKVRVLQAITGLGVGGAERVVLDLVAAIDHARFDTEIVSFGCDTSAFEVYGKPTAAHHLIDVKGQMFPKPWNVRRYVELLRRFRPDIVHAHMFHALAITLVASRIAAQRPKIVFTSHNSFMQRSRSAVVHATRSYRACDVVFWKNQHPGLNAKQIAVIPNGVTVDQQERRCSRMAGDPVRFVYVGRLSAQKNPVGIVKAFARSAIPNARLDLIGVGPLASQVSEAAQILGVQHAVRLLGLRRDVREQLRAADAFVMHSAYEGLPLALLEAGAEGLPVISTGVGAISELLEGARGYLADDEDQLSSAFRTVTENPKDAFDRGARLFAHVRANYSVAAMVQGHEGLYRSVACL